MKIPQNLEQVRRAYQPSLPKLFSAMTNLRVVEKNISLPVDHQKKIKELFPSMFGIPDLVLEEGGESLSSKVLRVGVVLSGGQAPGGHNVIVGLYEALKALNTDSQLWGFLKGPQGILEGDVCLLEEELIDSVRNQGGFDLIASGRTKIETPEQFEKTCERVKQMDLDGLIVIGGDDSNTNAALIAEHFKQKGISTCVVGVPKTIDGDLKARGIEISFGHDTACKTYSELIGNICRDVLSAKKYYHFIRLMGRSASHVTLECALQTQPNLSLISEEVLDRNLSLQDIAQEIASMVKKRSLAGKDYGVVLVPEGIIEFIPQMRTLIQELNSLLSIEEVSSALAGFEQIQDKSSYISQKLTPQASKDFDFLPSEIQRQLLIDRDPHGNVQVSRIETEKLLAQLTQKVLDAESDYEGKFSFQTHFFGYEGRSGYPTNFDSSYCLALGYAAASLIAAEKSGYMASVQNLTKDPVDWKAGGIPLTSLLTLETRHGKQKPVITKALVELEGNAFKEFCELRSSWVLEDQYCYPGPIQFQGCDSLTFQRPIAMQLENNKANC
jgi:diphosphate-dependent phosphofructokinase